MKRTLKILVGAAIAVAVISCAQFAGVSSLRGADVSTTDVAPVDLKVYAGKRPGSGAPIERAFKGQPPLIPHAIDNFDEITVAENQCLECHGPKDFAKKKAPKVGDSHLTAANSTTLRMDRYQCDSCHVPQVDAKPLVNNTFIGNAVPK
jgi:cytochrome c-type protein NapB